MSRFEHLYLRPLRRPDAPRQGARRRLSRPRTGRLGGSIVECTVALVILATAMASAAQWAVAAKTQQRLAAQRQIACQEAGNLMERVFALPPAELDDQHLSALKLSRTARQRLPSVRHTLTMDSDEQRPGGKRIVVEIQWTSRPGHWARPVRLVAWRYAPEVQP